MGEPAGGDANGTLIFESAPYDWNTGQLTAGPEAKVYEVKQGITPELAAWIGQDAGRDFPLRPKQHNGQG
ncbi:MAG: hypothetical protein R3C44_19960 [Chloroflexota bacterium]